MPLIPYIQTAQTLITRFMKTLHFLLFVVVTLLFTACGEPDRMADENKSKDRLAEEILALEGTLKKQMDNPTIDTASAASLIEKTALFADRFKQDSLTPHFLFKSAAVARGIGQYEKAVDLWDRTATVYPDFEKVPESIFFQGFTYDNDLKNNPKAAEKYEAFLQQFPKHPIAKDAKMLLEVVKSGKTANEVVKEFQQQNQATE
jgi:outer membrane protein assembly factor BamD (BamD/ComL family)